MGLLLTECGSRVRFSPAMFGIRVAFFAVTPSGEVKHLTALDSRQNILCGESVSLRGMSRL